VRALEDLLRSSGATPEIAVACSQALGWIKHDSSVTVLARVLRERRLLGFGRRWPDQVRATAALALYHLDHPSATRTLLRFTRDRDPRIRRLATALRAGARGPRPDLGIPGRAGDSHPPRPDRDADSSPMVEPGDRGQIVHGTSGPAASL
jgi:hypothetical protein